MNITLLIILLILCLAPFLVIGAFYILAFFVAVIILFVGGICILIDLIRDRYKLYYWKDKWKR